MRRTGCQEQKAQEDVVWALQKLGPSGETNVQESLDKSSQCSYEESVIQSKYEILRNTNAASQERGPQNVRLANTKRV